MPISHEEFSQILANNPALRIAREKRPRSPKPKVAIKAPPAKSLARLPSKRSGKREAAKRKRAAYSMSEADLLKCVLDLAKLKGWLVAHFRPAQTSRGWRTAVSADGSGFPDLVMVRHDRCLFVELKAERGKLSEAQAIWLGFLTGANQRGRVFIWKPSDWLSREIQKRLN